MREGWGRAWTAPDRLQHWWVTAPTVLADHPEGTDYRVVVRHGDPADRDRHEQLGFFDGWGAVTAALASRVESEVAA